MTENEPVNSEPSPSVKVKTCSLEQAKVLLGYKSITEAKKRLEDEEITPYNSDNTGPLYLRSDVLTVKYIGELDDLNKNMALLISENEGLVKLVTRQMSSGDIVEELELGETPEELYAGSVDEELWEKYEKLKEHFYGLRHNMFGLVLERMDLRKDNERLKDKLKE